MHSFLRCWCALSFYTPTLLGQEVEVVQAVTADGGLVRLEGDIWSARSTLGTIPAGGKARVVEIDGATAIVGTIQEQPLLP